MKRFKGDIAILLLALVFSSSVLAASKLTFTVDNQTKQTFSCTTLTGNVVSPKKSYTITSGLSTFNNTIVDTTKEAAILLFCHNPQLSPDSKKYYAFAVKNVIFGVAPIREFDKFACANYVGSDFACRTTVENEAPTYTITCHEGAKTCQSQ